MNQLLLEPNRGLLMPPTWQANFLVLSASVLALVTAFGLWQLVRKKEPLMLFLLLGGLLGVMLEPICDLLGMAYHPELGQVVGFHTLGRDIPLWVVLCYPWYFCLITYGIVSLDANGALTPKRYWLLFATAVTFCFGIEVFPVTQSVFWDYYGEQPLMFFAKAGVTHGMPLMWYVVNPTALIASAAFVALTTRHNKGWRRWPAAAIMPIGIVGFHTGAFAPIYMTINAGWSASQSLFSAALTALFCAVLLNAMANLLFNTRPVAGSGGASLNNRYMEERT